MDKEEYKKVVQKIVSNYAVLSVDNARVVANPDAPMAERMMASMSQSLNENGVLLQLAELRKVKNRESGGMVRPCKSNSVIIEPDTVEKFVPSNGSVTITVDAELTTDLHERIANSLGVYK